jgi:NAD(P)H-hydrate epimerase
VTLAAPKQGLRAMAAARAVGRLFLADITVPATAYQRLGVSYQTPFGSSSIVELTMLSRD